MNVYTNMKRVHHLDVRRHRSFLLYSRLYTVLLLERRSLYTWAAGEKNGERKHAEDEIEWEGREQQQARRRAQRASVCVCTYPHK